MTYIFFILITILIFTNIGRFIFGNIITKISNIFVSIFSSLSLVFVLILVLTLLKKGLL